MIYIPLLVFIAVTIGLLLRERGKVRRINTDKKAEELLDWYRSIK